MGWHGWRWMLMGLVLLAATAAGCGGCQESHTGGSTPGGDVSADVADIGLDGRLDAAADAGDDATSEPDAANPDTSADVEVGCGEAVECGGSCCAMDQECIQEECMDPCSGSRCGGGLELCCTGEQVCIFEACHLPGDDCSNSFECPEDEYCEQTLSQCLPRDAVTESCTWQPPVGEFTPVVKSHFPGVDHDGSLYSHSITAPLVADVTGDGSAEIVALLYTGGLSEALIAVIDGVDASLVAYGGVGEVRPNSAGIAVGQLDASTDELEIVAGMPGGGLIAFQYDPQAGELVEWWRNSDGPLGNISYEMAPLLADLDADGTPEIILGFSVVDSQGDIWNGLNGGAAGGQGGSSANSAAVDLDGDGELELVAGNRAMKLDGTMLWDRSADIPDGYPAVGDFGNDGVPNVVNVSGGQVWVLDGIDGSTVFGPLGVPGGGQGGPPTIADFDGDDRVEFAAAGRGRYTVYDLDCTGASPDPVECASGRDDGILWSVDVQDLSSSRTGSSVFDFEGDGRAEVVYNDECFLRVFDGVNGDVLYEQANSSRTGSEYPIVVDVTGDFSAEIVVVANNDQIARDNCEDNNDNYPDGGTTGVYVYADADSNWVPTRSIWNQHAYHITNVRDDGTIPAQQPVHYQSSITNSFRLNAQPDGLFNAPDLIVDDIELLGASCGQDVVVELAVTVKNVGSLGVGAGVEVDVEAISGGTTTTIGSVQTTRRLLPAESERLLLSWTVPQQTLDDGFELVAEVDPDAAINECDTTNNSASHTPTADELDLSALAITEVDVADAACGAGGGIDVSVTVANQGGTTIAAGVPVVIEALRPARAQTLATVTTAELATGDTEQFDVSWDVSNDFFGAQFDVRATIDPDDDAQTCSSGAFAEDAVDCIPGG